MKSTPVLAVPAMLILLTASAASAQDLQPPPPEGQSGAVPETQAPLPPIQPVEETADSGLGLEWVYITAGGGGAYTNMTSLSASNLQVQQTTSTGGSFDVGAGVRLLFVSAGVRARDLQLSAFNLWELDAEAALHMRVWHIDPYFGARGGYVTVGGLSAAETNASSGAAASTSATSNENVHGFNVGPMFGIDIYFSSLFTIGAEVNAEFLILERPPIPVPASVTAAMQATGTALTPQQQQLYNQSGSSVGFGVVGSAQLGLHF
jgi:hypothetical protein